MIRHRDEKAIKGITALVPIKARHHCKTRLANHLSTTERLSLVCSMADHVLHCLQQVPAITRIVVVSPERGHISRDFEVLADCGWDLNSSVEYAVEQLRHEGEAEILVMPADLACLSHQDLELLIAESAQADVTIAPSDDELGTNALLLRGRSLKTQAHEATAFPLLFGTDSFQRHVTQAQQLGLTYRTVKTAGLGFDLDTDRDLDRLQQTLPTFVDCQQVACV